MRILRAGVASLALVAAGLRAGAQQADPSPSPSPSAAPSPSPSPAFLPARPISGSVEGVVERYLAEHLEPCKPATAQTLPCFPASVEAQAPEDSVATALQRYKADGGPPLPLNLTPNGTPVVGVSFDPFCAAKALWKAVRGRNNTYYLYRVWDPEGERAMLRDQPLAPGTHQAFPYLQFELVATLHGECEAVAAWRKANREALDRNKASARPR